MIMLSLVAIIGLFVVYVTLSRRIDTLEKQLSGKSAPADREPQPVPTPHMEPAREAMLTERYSLDAPTYRPTSVPDNDQNRFDPIAWLAQDFLVKVGAFLLLLAFGWFVSYAFMNDWIGPAGRIALGLMAGAAFMAAGIWRIEAYRHQGGIFTVLGAAIVLLTMFAAREIYEFFTPVSALAIMFLSVAFVTFVALRYQSQPLALAGLVLGAVAPFFTNTDPNVVGLFSYAMVLVAGSLWAQRWLGAVSLSVAAFLVVVVYGLPYLLMSLGDAETTIALLFAFAFTMVFFISNTVSILMRPDADARYIQSLVAAGTGLYLIAWVYAAADPVWHSLVFVMWMLVFAVGAFIVFLRTSQTAPFFIYGAISVGLLAAATAAELSGPILTIAYCFEIVALMAVAALYTQDKTVVSKISWLFIGPILLSITHIMSGAWRDGFLHGDFFALTALLFCLLVAGQIIIELRTPEESRQTDDATALLVAATLYALVLVWLVSHSVLPDGVATTVSLFIYTISGLTAYLYGRNTGQEVIAQGGIVLLALVIGRLLLVDVWSMELVGRIVTFFGIGVLLISTAFVRRVRVD